MALFGFLRPDRARLEHLERQVADLVAAHEAREIAFLAIADQVKRHLSRTAAIEQRSKGRESTADPVTSAVLSMKFPPKRGNGSEG